MELLKYEKEHAEKVRATLGECMVLLKRDGSFPLERPGCIAAFGSGVRHTVKGGTGSGEVNSRYFINIEQGLIDAGFTVTTSLWLNVYDNIRAAAKKAFAKKIRREAAAARENIITYASGRSMPEPEYEIPLIGRGDTAIYVVSRISGEGSDRPVKKGEILLSDSEVRDILALDASYKRFMLVLNTGGVVDLSPVKSVRNILVMSQLGSDSGTALAEVLLGAQNPSGRLTTTWAAWSDYFPMDDFEDIDKTEYREGIYVGYRYFDSFEKEVIFPFGHGLSYTDFSFGKFEVSLSGSEVSVRVRAKNKGAFAGREVVQVYMSSPAGTLDQPYQELAGFVKTDDLKPGEEQELRISFDMRNLASYDEGAEAYVLEAGEYIIRAGKSSRDTEACALIELSEDITVRKTGNVLGDPGFKDMRSDMRTEKSSAEKYPEGIIRLKLDAEAVKRETVESHEKYRIPPEIQAISSQEAALLTIGGFDPSKSGLANVIGSAGKHVCGAAGETASSIEGIPYITMADGPAGLRLTKDYYVDEKGSHSLSATGPLESIGEYLPAPVRFAMKLVSGGGRKPVDAEVKHQYCTSIPIGTAVAQSFNIELAESYGDIVGSEMEMFGVHLWLAPALNIHRSIRCGRNFEYFSEDPLISGAISAAVTRGVQKHPGCGTTIKHYAANNKELNRYCNDSRVSERAMREIYLRGFELCIKETEPLALMTSYNLLNGTHTAEHKGLIEDILRNEFGFGGLVMTDWVVPMTANRRSVNRNSKPRFVAAAGGDLFMPGSKSDFQDLLQGIEYGDVNINQVRTNAGRVVKTAKILNKLKD